MKGEERYLVNMLSFDETTFGIQDFKVDLRELFPLIGDRRDFYTRFEDFLESDRYNQQVFARKGDIFTYKSEIFVSPRIDNRPPVLLLLGNPASHSVAEGMCFAYEKGGQEHRFWRLLAESGILKFPDLPPIYSDVKKNIEARRKALLELDYQSPFRIGIAVFYSMPSAASDKTWQGVSGIKRLLGNEAFKQISFQEGKRITLLTSKFIKSTGGIIAFQKDAYNAVRSLATPEYDRNLARQGLMVGDYLSNQRILVCGSPPTREAYWPGSKSALRKYSDWLLGNFIR